MRLAIPVWNDRVSPVFDTAGRVLLLDLADGIEQARHTVEVAQTSSPGERVKRLAELGVNVLVCGAISRPLASRLSAAGIVLIPWVSGALEEVLRAYLTDRLSDPCWRMPGCGGRHRHGNAQAGPRGPRRS
jgi:predicted Fe-Mo cluster-binding NifX family protein